MSFTAYSMPKKAGWIEVTRYFFSTKKGDVGGFKKMAAWMAAALRSLAAAGGVVAGGPLAFLDDAASFIPVVQIWTIGNNVLAAYLLYALFKIWRIRKEVNRQRGV